MNEERTPDKSDSPKKEGKIRLRAIVVGLAFAVAICALTPFNNAHRHGTPLGGGHFPLAPFFILTWLTVGVAVLRKAVQESRLDDRKGTPGRLDTDGPGLRDRLHGAGPDLFHQPHGPLPLRHRGKPLGRDPTPSDAREALSPERGGHTRTVQRVSGRKADAVGASSKGNPLGRVASPFAVLGGVHTAQLLLHALPGESVEQTVAAKRAHELSPCSGYLS